MKLESEQFLDETEKTALKEQLKVYDASLDSKDSDVQISSDGFLYYLNPKGEAIITNGRKPYLFPDCELSIPERIDGHPVVAIGNAAFRKAVFGSLLLPDSIKEIGSYAFSDAEFDLLVLPKKLNVLNPYVFDSDPRWIENTKDRRFPFVTHWNTVVWPTEIQYASHKLSMTEFMQQNKEFRIAKSYRKIPYETYLSFKHDSVKRTWAIELPDGTARLLLTLNAKKPEDVPNTFYTLRITQWEATVLVRLAALKKKREWDENNRYHCSWPYWPTMDWDQLNWSIRIPDNVEQITSEFGSYGDIKSGSDGDEECCQIIASPTLKTISGFESHLPILLKSENDVPNRIFIYGKTYPISREIKEKGIDYLIWNIDGKDLACAINVDKNMKRVSLPKEVQGIEVRTSLLTISQKLDFFETYQRDFEEDAPNLYYVNFLQGVRTFQVDFDSDRGDQVDFLSFVLPNMKVDQIIVKDGFTSLYTPSNQRFQPLDEKEISIYFPRSLECFYSDELVLANIHTIFAFENAKNERENNFATIYRTLPHDDKQAFFNACVSEEHKCESDYVINYMNQNGEVVQSVK